METKKEIRNLDFEDAEIRLIEETKKVIGYALVFDKLSEDLGGFREIISPESLEGVLEKSDVLALLNHNRHKGVLARSNRMKGTLELKIDRKGLKYSFEPPNYSLGHELVEGIRRGDIQNSSFAFSLPDGGAEFKRTEDGELIRIIHKFDKIFDVSPCYTPAYQDTTVAIRSLEEFRESEEETEPVVEDPTPEESEVQFTNEYIRKLEIQKKIINIQKLKK